ncbi:MAG: type II secretion system protein [Planctomycetes bacterium]|nr:type II secretion system protein [Planctomycetota bacterium]MCH8119826.1 type II secretion system protein [Planctomycetota bacterium]
MDEQEEFKPLEIEIVSQTSGRHLRGFVLRSDVRSVAKALERRRLRRVGFTLIELLVVIAIIALLMAILMPALNKAREQGQRIVCKSNLKNYTLAIQMYTDDNDDKFCRPESAYFSQTAPYPVESGLISPIHLRWCNGDLNLKNHPQYASPFFAYLQNVKVFICPTFARITLRSSQDHFYQADAGNLKNYKPWYNYTMNAYLGSPSSSVKKSSVRKLSEVKHLAETFSFTEESALVDTRYNVSGLNDTYMIPGSDSMVEGWLNQAGSYRLIKPGPEGVGQFWDVIAGFHYAPSQDPLGGKGNCAFLDGHVGAHPRAETFPLAWPH